MSKHLCPCHQLSRIFISVKTLVSLSAALSYAKDYQNTCLPVIISQTHSGMSKQLSHCHQLSRVFNYVKKVCLLVSSSLMYSGLSKHLSYCHQLSPTQNLSKHVSLSSALSYTQTCKNTCVPVISSLIH